MSSASAGKAQQPPSHKRSSIVWSVCQSILSLVLQKKSPGPPQKQWWGHTSLIMFWEGHHEWISQNYSGWLRFLLTRFITLVLSFLRHSFYNPINEQSVPIFLKTRYSCPRSYRLRLVFRRSDSTQVNGANQRYFTAKPKQECRILPFILLGADALHISALKNQEWALSF